MFAALSLGYVIWNEALKEKRQKADNAPGLSVLPETPTAKLLDEPWFEPVQSVTENTTKLLPVEKKSNNP